jgi:hypothetical protein
MRCRVIANTNSPNQASDDLIHMRVIWRQWRYKFTSEGSLVKPVNLKVRRTDGWTESASKHTSRVAGTK